MNWKPYGSSEKILKHDIHHNKTTTKLQASNWNCKNLKSMLRVKATVTDKFRNKLGTFTNSELTPKHPSAWILLYNSLVHLPTYRFIHRFDTMVLTSTFCFVFLASFWFLELMVVLLLSINMPLDFSWR